MKFNECSAESFGWNERARVANFETASARTIAAVERTDRPTERFSKTLRVSRPLNVTFDRWLCHPHSSCPLVIATLGSTTRPGLAHTFTRAVRYRQEKAARTKCVDITEWPDISGRATCTRRDDKFALCRSFSKGPGVGRGEKLTYLQFRPEYAIETVLVYATRVLRR